MLLENSTNCIHSEDRERILGEISSFMEYIALEKGKIKIVSLDDLFNF